MLLEVSAAWAIVGLGFKKVPEVASYPFELRFSENETSDCRSPKVIHFESLWNADFHLSYQRRYVTQPDQKLSIDMNEIWSHDRLIRSSTQPSQSWVVGWTMKTWWRSWTKFAQRSDIVTKKMYQISHKFGHSTFFQGRHATQRGRTQLRPDATQRCHSPGA